jgi:hypothetical protein
MSVPLMTISFLYLTHLYQELGESVLWLHHRPIPILAQHLDCAGETVESALKKVEIEREKRERGECVYERGGRFARKGTLQRHINQ